MAANGDWSTEQRHEKGELGCSPILPVAQVAAADTNSSSSSNTINSSRYTRRRNTTPPSSISYYKQLTTAAGAAAMGSEGIANQADTSWLTDMKQSSRAEQASHMDSWEQTAALQAAQQMLANLLTVPNLSARVAGGLRSVSSLLRLAENRQQQPKTKRSRCSLPQDYTRHLSSWSTTTTATGLPTDEPPVPQNRPVSFRGLHGSRLSLSLVSSLSNGSSSSLHYTDHLSPLHPPPPLLTKSLSMPKSHSFSDVQTGALLDSLAARRYAAFGRMSLANTALAEAKQEDSSPEGSTHSNVKGKVSNGAIEDYHVDNVDVHTADAELQRFVIEETDNSALLTSEAVSQWDFPIFSLADLYPDSALSVMAYKLFSEIDLIESFRIPVPEFINFFHALEMGYRDNPYHNRMHATDVLHAVYYMTTQPVPGFSQMSPDNELLTAGNSTRQKSPGQEGDEHPDRHVFTAADTYGIIGGNLPALELMALFTAAAMHDYDHPGRTNAFLVTTQAPLAVLYNDRSVLESHHAASAWRLYLSDPRFQWLANLDSGEFKRLRYLVIELILATDLKRHFELVAEFNTKVNASYAPGVDWTSERDRLMVSNMIIKMADICGPTKSRGLHLSWTHRIAAEFYEQGDDEARLGLPISPYMDRKQPQLARLQESFVSHLVEPLCTALSIAELLPGLWTVEEEKDSNCQDGADTDSDTQRRKIACPMVINLKSNHDYWKQEIAKEPPTNTDKSES